MNTLLEKLAVGDMRTTGRVEEVVREVLHAPQLFADLFMGLTDSHPGIRMRTADAIEKIAAQNPTLVQPYKDRLVQIAKTSTQQEIQWHLAQLFAYIDFSLDELTEIMEIVEGYYATSTSNIVKVMALQTLVNLSQQKISSRAHIQVLLTQAQQTGSPSVKARARKLQKQMDAVKHTDG